MVIFRAISGKQICRRGASFIIVCSSGQLSQISFAIEFPTDGMGLHLEFGRIAEMQKVAVSSPEPRLVKRIVFVSQEAEQTAMMPVNLTRPRALPRPFDGVFTGRRYHGAAPVVFEAGATAEQ